ncbi:MAG: efflux RND transporter periplasmic adaptor subunit [Rhodospirillaceae bacterium]
MIGVALRRLAPVLAGIWLSLVIPGSTALAASGTLPWVRALVAPRNETVLSSQILGRIAKLSLRPGDSFRQGETLFALDCRLYQAQWGRAKSELNRAQRTLEMQKRLEDLGSGSRYDRTQANAAVERAGAELTQMSLTLEMCVVTAPFDGRVVERKAQPQQVIAPGQPVLEIYETKNFDIQLLVPSQWLSWLSRGRRFSVHVEETGGDYDAEVMEIGARIDPASQSVKVFGRFEDTPESILAGMSGTASFPEPSIVKSPGDDVARPPWSTDPGVARPVWRIERQVRK